MTERRRFMRFDTAMNAMFEIASESGLSSSEIRNISKDGALLLLARQLTQGTEMKLSMDVPGDNVPVFASCEVAWQSSSDKGFETGVRFKDLDNSDKGRLLEFIYTQWLKLIDSSK